MTKRILAATLVLLLAVILAGCRGNNEERAMGAVVQKYIQLVMEKNIDEAAKLVTGNAAIEIEQYGKTLKADPSKVALTQFSGHVVYLNRDKTRGLYEANYEKSLAVEDLGETKMSYVGQFGLVKMDGAWKIYSVRLRNAEF